VGIPKPEKLQDFFYKAVVMDKISSDPEVQKSLINKAEKLLKSNDLGTAYSEYLYLYKYRELRQKYEGTIITGLAYCMVFKY
jgi:hypothetical protein